ncbi:MAG: hypothetical protein J7L51_04040 [Desulfurococcales archaeon]|nr:hypothetical protein [Desulfurococcales archaeon]
MASILAEEALNLTYKVIEVYKAKVEIIKVYAQALNELSEASSNLD